MCAGKIGLVQFGTFTDLEWLKISVAEINLPVTKGTEECDDKQKDKIKTRQNTPYDERMGVLEDGKFCLTCAGTTEICPGHFGHIKLPFPIYSLQFLPICVKILQCICPHCSRPRIIPDHSELKGFLKAKRDVRLRILVKESVKVYSCPWKGCEQVLPQFDMMENKMGIKIFYLKKGKNQAAKRKGFLNFEESECLSVFEGISNEHITFLGFNDSLSKDPKFVDKAFFSTENTIHAHQFRPESMIFTILPVIPPTSRPYTVRDGKKCDDDLTEGYNSIIKKCNQLIEEPKKKTIKLRNRQKIVEALKMFVWTLIDNTKEGCKLSNGGRPHKCIKQRIKGKDGRMQGNVGGKRTDQSARTVITPGGVYLQADEIGVPPLIASELTTKEYIRPQNLREIQELVNTNQIKRVTRGSSTIRLDSSIFNGKNFRLIVGDVAERCMKDGDYWDNLILNRQPSLRVESMMGLRAKLMPGYSFRLSLCWTSAFNADFDGDCTI